MMRAHHLLPLLLLFALPAGGDEFWQHWGDGKAELSAYALTQPRYGAPRDGTVVLIFVTEDMSDSLRVKADPGKHPSRDVYPVLKLNQVRDFQTGIYDYNVMSSLFVRTEWGPSGFPWPVVKSSFSAQEWCGHVYQQWLVRGTRMVGASHSYFDGEADATQELLAPSNGIFEEALPILVRHLRGDWLKPGEQRQLPYLPSSLRARLLHQPQAWGEAIISRAAESPPVATVLGRLAAYVYTVVEKGGPTTTFTVEAAPPHRLLAWQSSDGEAGRLLGSARLPYWQLNQPGGESSLKLLGLPVPGAAATPPSKRGR